MLEKIKVIDDEIKHKKIGIIVTLENLGDDLEKEIDSQVKRQCDLGARLIKLCDKGNNIDNEAMKNYIGSYEFNWYTDFFVMKLPCESFKGDNPKVSLEELTEEEDVVEFVKLYNECFGEVPNSATYEEKDVMDQIKDTSVSIGFIKSEGKRVGFYELVLEDGDEGELNAIGILEGFRGKELGKTAILMINDKFWKMNYKNTKLLVASINDKAYKLYKKMGFEVSGERYSRWYHLEM